MRQPALEAPYLALLEKLRSAGERNAFVLAALGRKALRESDPNAIAYLKQAIEGNVISPIPFQDLDEALWRDGQREESVRTLQRGLERFPFAAALHKLLASRYISLKQYASARKTIVHYLELFPEDTFMREMLRKFDTAADANSSVKN
jgi:tetratricopeptide (TPR) repeat protein